MRLFIIGVGPLPFYRSPRPATALSDGTWQLIQPLLQEGHRIRAVTLEFGQRTMPEIDYLQKPEEISENLEHQAYPEPLRESRTQIARQMQQSLAAFHPDAVISAGSVIAAWVTTRLKHQLPLWYDLKGAFLPELQLRMESPDAEATFETFSVYKQVLLRGDRFSAVTARQADMVMGELGMVGRLNPATLHEKLVTVKPTGLPPDSPRRLPRTGRIRGRLCDEDCFVLFSSGGFNTWQDTRTFFRTIERILLTRRDVCFVCIGGGIGGHHDQGYEAFRSWVNQSAARERIFLKGWVPQDQVIEYESEADLGLNFDLDVPESHYGDRSRFLSWMARGVGVATTPVSPPSRLLVEQDLALGLPVGDWSTAAARILQLIENRDQLRQMTQKAETFVRTQWTYHETTRHLRAWAAHPVLAEDNRRWFYEGKLSPQFELGSLELAMDYVYTGAERWGGNWMWHALRGLLAQRWPWDDGHKWWLASEMRDRKDS
jgi:glycosyltransferase involved in cell wall biosynthesis